MVRKGLAEDPELRHADMRALIDALLAEPPESEQPVLRDDEKLGAGDDGGLLNTPAEDAPRGDGTLLLPRPRPAPERRVGWWAFVGGLAGALVVGLVVAGLVVALVPGLISSPPEKAAGTLVSDSDVVPGDLVSEEEISPYDELLKALEDNDFGAAKNLWDNHGGEGAKQILSDKESLFIAQTAFERAKKLDEAGEPAAEKAAEFASIVLSFIQMSSSDEVVLVAASGLYGELLEFTQSRKSNSAKAGR